MAEGRYLRLRPLWLKSKTNDILMLLADFSVQVLWMSIGIQLHMGENISHSLYLLELRVKLPHLQKFVIIELQSINLLQKGMIWRVEYKKKNQFSSVQFENLFFLSIF